MRKTTILLVALGFLVQPQAAFSQGMFETGGIDSMAVGLGAGLGASIGKGMLVNKTYQAGVNAEMSAAQILQLQTRAIEQYMKLGCDFQAKKQWQNAEKSFRYVLQVSTIRDGYGSPKSSPALQHLAQVSAAQGNLLDAIGFQERVVNLAKNQKLPEPASVISAQIGLCNYYLQKQDYHSAEPVIEESYELAQKSSSLPLEKRRVVARTYGNLLRKIGKKEKAEQVDPSPIATNPTTLAPSPPPSSIPPTAPVSTAPATSTTSPATSAALSSPLSTTTATSIASPSSPGLTAVNASSAQPQSKSSNSTDLPSQSASPPKDGQ
jgi:tetratricopeptide (TPR) repeat protein